MTVMFAKFCIEDVVKVKNMGHSCFGQQGIVREVKSKVNGGFFYKISVKSKLGSFAYHVKGSNYSGRTSYFIPEEFLETV